MTADPRGDRCPRCGGGFHCGANDAAACPCATVTLDAKVQLELRQRFDGCLCLRCLGDIARGAATTLTPDASGSGEQRRDFLHGCAST